MLILSHTCILDDTPAYSGASVYANLGSVNTISGYVDPITMIGNLIPILENAGWSQVNSGPSGCIQVRIGLDVPFDSGTGTASHYLPPSSCSGYGPAGWTFNVGIQNFQLYPPSSVVPPGVCPNGTVFVPMGDTQDKTAINMALAITYYTAYNCDFLGTSPPEWITGAGFEFQFTTKKNYPSSDDLVDINVGTGPANTSGGFYTFQSGSLNGGTISMNFGSGQWGAFTDSILFSVLNLLGGVAFQQYIFTGEYHAVACPYQFVIWQNGTGTQLSDIGPHGTFIEHGYPATVLVSMLWSDPYHNVGNANDVVTNGPNPVLVIGSGGTSGLITFDTNPLQLTNIFNWTSYIATGLNSEVNETGSPGGDVSRIDFGPSLAFRGLRGSDIETLSELPFVQAAHVLLSNNPSGTVTSIYAGKLWDMITMSSFSSIALGGKVKYDGQDWMQLGEDSQSVSFVSLPDLFGSLWILSDGTT